MWRRGGLRLWSGGALTRGPSPRTHLSRLLFQQGTRSIAGAGPGAGEARMIQVDLMIGNEFRKLIPNKRRKAKIKVPMTSLPTLQSLKEQVNHTFPNLKEISYGMRFVIPHKTDIIRPFQDDQDLVNALELSTASDSHSLRLYIDAPQKQMANPLDSPSYTMVSFYTFQSISNPDAMVTLLKEMWRPFKCYGRVYVAEEGVNAQMAIPSNVLLDFQKICKQFPLFSDVSINVDHHLTSEEYFKTRPFKALHVRHRKQIVTDGFDHSLDWKDAGTELAPHEWDEQLRGASQVGSGDRGKSAERPLLFDCRNVYESEIGLFEGAIPLNTVRFSDSWDILEKALEGKPKDTPIMTYCTGGIRCVKINAFLKQTLGFTNTSRLKGGIISYAREIRQTIKASSDPIESCTTSSDVLPSEGSTFKGVNYVFDDRMGSRITEDILGLCETCGNPWDGFTNCRNSSCSVRFLQCPTCSSHYSGCCSLACQQNYREILDKNAAYVPPRKKDHISYPRPRSFSTSAASADGISLSVGRNRKLSTLSSYQEQIESYCERMSETEPSYLTELRLETQAAFPEAAHMISGPLQGRLLSQLSTLVKPRRVLELGTFTGYATLCLAEGLKQPHQQDFPNQNSWEGEVVTIDKDLRAAQIAQKYFQRFPHLQIDLKIGSVGEVIQSLVGQFDLVYIDADKKGCWNYLTALIGDHPQDPTRPSLLSPGALILTDNTLWKGRVVEEPMPSQSVMDKKQHRAEQLTRTIHDFNLRCASHPLLRTVMVPLRDGLTISRYVPLAPSVRTMDPV